MSMAVSEAELMMSSVRRAGTDDPLCSGEPNTVLLPTDRGNEWHQVDIGPLRTRRHISLTAGRGPALGTTVRGRGRGQVHVGVMRPARNARGLGMIEARREGAREGEGGLPRMSLPWDAPSTTSGSCVGALREEWGVEHVTATRAVIPEGAW